MAESENFPCLPKTNLMNCLACDALFVVSNDSNIGRDELLEFIAICRNCGTGNTIDNRANIENTPDFRRFGPIVEICLLLFRLRRTLSLTWAGIFLQNKAILDYGCGRGELLSLMRKFGWAIEGTEYSFASAREAIAKSIPLKLYEQYNDDPIKFFEDASFDFVTSFHNLEHLTSPRDFLQNAYNKIKPNGKLIIEVPNFASLQSRMAREKWVLLDPGNHPTHFTKQGLKIALNESKFEILSVRTTSVQYGLFGMVEALRLRAFGSKRASVFEQLQKDKSQGGEVKYRVFLEAAILLIPGALLEAFSVIRGRGAVIRVVCRKL